MRVNNTRRGNGIERLTSRYSLAVVSSDIIIILQKTCAHHIFQWCPTKIHIFVIIWMDLYARSLILCTNHEYIRFIVYRLCTGLTGAAETRKKIKFATLRFANSTELYTLESMQRQQALLIILIVDSYVQTSVLEYRRPVKSGITITTKSLFKKIGYHTNHSALSKRNGSDIIFAALSSKKYGMDQANAFLHSLLTSAPGVPNGDASIQRIFYEGFW